MGKPQFFVYHNKETLGPWSEEELRKKLRAGKVSYTDYVWDPVLSAWTLMAVYYQSDFQPPQQAPDGAEAPAQAAAVVNEPMATTAENAIPEATPNLKQYKEASFQQDMSLSNESIWFLYREGQKYGPYRYLELVQLLQTQKCLPDDFIWKPGMQDWERLRQVSEFSNEILSRLSTVQNFGGVALDQVFIARRFPRVPYDGEVILHDDNQVIFGEATTISEGGAFIEIPKVTHQKGERLKLHFSPAGVSVPFNCIAEITQVCKTKPTGYCLKFIYLEEDDQKRIADFAGEVTSQSS